MFWYLTAVQLVLVTNDPAKARLKAAFRPRMFLCAVRPSEMSQMPPAVVVVRAMDAIRLGCVRGPSAAVCMVRVPSERTQLLLFILPALAMATYCGFSPAVAWTRSPA